MVAMGNAKDILNQIEMDEKENFSDKTKAHFQQDPDSYRSFVKGIEREVNSSFPIVSALLGSCYPAGRRTNLAA